MHTSDKYHRVTEDLYLILSKSASIDFSNPRSKDSKPLAALEKSMLALSISFAASSIKGIRGAAAN